jgi:DNA modification methylase
MINDIYKQDCVDYLDNYDGIAFDLTFLDPPFNQSKEYRSHNDKLPFQEYWDWMKKVCELVYQRSSQGAAIYFMQREKNTQFVLHTLEDTGWTFQNLIIWKKKTSAIPCNIRYGKHYQIIAFATKGTKPKLFNKLRIDPPLLETEKIRRSNGMFVTDVWDDIRELTSGYFAGDEPLRFDSGVRIHKQQSPIHLLVRIILSSTKIGDTVFDPFAGTGTTLIVAKQLHRNSIGVELDGTNYNFIKNRIDGIHNSDNINKYINYYRFTENLEDIWPISEKTSESSDCPKQLHIF